LDSRGYFPEDISDVSSELGILEETVKKALKIVQSLEPDGIAARNINECLKIQTAKKGVMDENIYKVIDSYLELLAENKYSQLAKEIGVDSRKAQEYGDFIKSLEPKPSRGFYTGDEVKYIIPDAYIKKIDDEYFIIMNEDLMPRLTINDMYKEIIKEDTNKEAVEYVKDRLNSALFLIKSIEHRKSTIYRVIEKLLELQREYFDYGEAYLKPMTLKEIADSLEVHESTVSRAIREKYIYTSKGTIRLKDLFTVGLSSNDSGEDISTRTIKNEIKIMIEKEDKHSPLSDQNICDLLNNAGMNISRRTVAKYREELGIKSSKGRKRF
jgi:RNA polymerase sigma-54 factor